MVKGRKSDARNQPEPNAKQHKETEIESNDYKDAI
jgi:hypothetical protein